VSGATGVTFFRYSHLILSSSSQPFLLLNPTKSGYWIPNACSSAASAGSPLATLLNPGHQW